MRLLTTGILVIGLAISGSSAPVMADAENVSPAGREVTIPAGTALPVVLDTGVGSDISRIEGPVNAHLARPIVIGGQTVLADGSRLSGVVTECETRDGNHDEPQNDDETRRVRRNRGAEIAEQTVQKIRRKTPGPNRVPVKRAAKDPARTCNRR